MSSPSLPAVAHRRTLRLRAQPTAFVASLLFHTAALAAIATWRISDDKMMLRRLQIQQGRDSAPLAASVARPKSQPPRDVALHMEKTPPAKQEFAERAPPLVGGAMKISRRDTELPRKSDGMLPQLIHGKPALSSRATRGEPLELSSALVHGMSPPAPPRIQSAPRLIESEPFSDESVASASSRSSSGAVNGIPKKILHVEPLYPDASKRSPGEEGVVKLRIRVDRHGNVVETAIHASSGYQRLDQSALQAANSWKYELIGDSPGAILEFIESLQFRLNRTVGKQPAPE